MSSEFRDNWQCLLMKMLMLKFIRWWGLQSTLVLDILYSMWSQMFHYYPYLITKRQVVFIVCVSGVFCAVNKYGVSLKKVLLLYMYIICKVYTHTLIHTHTYRYTFFLFEHSELIHICQPFLALVLQYLLSCAPLLWGAICPLKYTWCLLQHVLGLPLFLHNVCV